MGTLVSHFVGAWASLYSNSAMLRTFVAFVHIAGLVGGGGAAIAADRGTLRATRRGAVIGRPQLESIHHTHRTVVFGLAAVIVSGLLLFAADVETYAVSKVFWLKMAMVAGLMVNGAVLVRVAGNPRGSAEHTRRTLRWTAAASLALWFLITLAGAGLPNI
jgi:hypothetical protein